MFICPQSEDSQDLFTYATLKGHRLISQLCLFLKFEHAHYYAHAHANLLLVHAHANYDFGSSVFISLLLVVKMYLYPTLVLVIILSSSSALVRLPITRRHVAMPLTSRAAMALNVVKQSAGKTNRQSPYKLPMQIDGYEFSINMTIGTPPQHFSMAFDTAGDEEGDFWVPSIACDPLYIQCKTHRQYDHRKSSTFNSSGVGFQTDLGTTGLLCSDTMSFGPLQIKLQEFGEGWNFPSGLNIWHSDSYYGFSPMEHMDTGLSLFYNMVKLGLLPEPVIGMYIVQENSGSHGDGELLLGGRDSSCYQGNLTYFDITNEEGLNGWQIRMDSVKVPSLNLSYCVGGCNAVLANQDPYIAGKYPDLENLNIELGAVPYKIDLFVDIFRFNCKTVGSLPQVVFVFHGKEFVIGPKQYVLPMKDDETNETVCVSAFLGIRYEDLDYDWSLGSGFFESAYVEFNLQHNQVGLAPSAN